EQKQGHCSQVFLSSPRYIPHSYYSDQSLPQRGPLALVSPGQIQRRRQGSAMESWKATCAMCMITCSFPLIYNFSLLNLLFRYIPFKKISEGNNNNCYAFHTFINSI